MSKWSNEAILGLILLIVGALWLIIVGIIIEVNLSNNVNNEWYVWGALVVGFLVFLLGIILFGFGLRKNRMNKVVVV